MAGHGSPPPEDRGSHPGRQVSRPLTRLTNAMMWQGALSRGEATAGIAAHRRGDPYGGSEAVAHYGGPTKLISDVMRNPAARKYGRQYSDLRQND